MSDLPANLQAAIRNAANHAFRLGSAAQRGPRAQQEAAEYAQALLEGPIRAALATAWDAGFTASRDRDA